jgi:hypothetical protein
MLPPWFVQTLSDILTTTKQQANENLKTKTSKPSLLLLKSPVVLSQYPSKIDRSLSARRRRRAIARQIESEFGVTLLSELGYRWLQRQTNERLFPDRRR